MKFAAAVLLCMSLTTPVFALADAFPEEWVACKENTDCVKAYACEDVALNKNYVKDFEESFDAGCNEESKPNPKAVAQCVEKECTIIVPDEKK